MKEPINYDIHKLFLRKIVVLELKEKKQKELATPWTNLWPQILCNRIWISWSIYAERKGINKKFLNMQIFCCSCLPVRETISTVNQQAAAGVTGRNITTFITVLQDILGYMQSCKGLFIFHVYHFRANYFVEFNFFKAVLPIF